MDDSRKFILVVEDEHGTQEVLRRQLESAGHIVFMAGNGAAALEKMKQAIPDLIISDVLMPVMDGFTFYQRLKANPATAKVPLLIMTARKEMENPFRSLGIKDFIGKPFEGQQLTEKVESLLNRKKREAVYPQPDKEAFLAYAARPSKDTPDTHQPKPASEQKKVFFLILLGFGILLIFAAAWAALSRVINLLQIAR